MYKLSVLTSVILCGGAVLNAAAQESRDPRVRTFVMPTRVMWQSPDSQKASVANAEVLLSKRFGQVPEGQFLAGSGCRLENKGEPASILVDFGRELHGGVHLASGAASSEESGKRVVVRLAPIKNQGSELLCGSLQLRIREASCCAAR